MTRARDTAGIIGSQKLTIDTNNNIGIGSTTPDAKFDVNGTFTVAGVSTFSTVLKVGTAVTISSGVITATTFSGNLSGNVSGNVTGNLTGTASTATAAATAYGLTGSPNVTVGSVNSSGIVTASSFVGSGANLTGLPESFNVLDAALFN